MGYYFWEGVGEGFPVGWGGVVGIGKWGGGRASKLHNPFASIAPSWWPEQIIGT